MTQTIDPAAQIVLDAIRNRRSMPYTALKPDPIREEHIDLLLESANWAPTHKYTEPWRFVLFTGAGRNRFAEILSQTYRQTAGEKFNERKLQKAIARPLNTALVVAIVMRRSEMIPEYEEILAVGCAVQNFHLAAHALGISGRWSTPAYMDHPNIRALLELEDCDRCFGFFYAGYAAEPEHPPRSVRGPIAEKVRRITN